MISVSTIQNSRDIIEKCFFNYSNSIESIRNNNIWEGKSRDNAYTICKSFNDELMNKLLGMFDEFKTVISKYEEYKEYESENIRFNIEMNKTENDFEKKYYQNKINGNNTNLTELKKEINSLLESINAKKISSILEIKIPERNTNPITTEGTPIKWFGKDNWYAIGGNAGTGNINQCTGYAYGRFNEIAEANGTKILTGNMGNGQDFYRMGKKAGYENSENINDIRVGDTISWAYGAYGHVAVVENLKRDSNGKVISVEISEGNMTGDPNSKGACHYHKQTFNGTDALNKLATRTIRRYVPSKFVGLVHQTSIK